MNRIDTLKTILDSRLGTLSHIVDLGVNHFTDETALLQSRLAPDMYPFGSQIALACNQPRWFAQWCAGQELQPYPPEVASLAQARGMIAETRVQVAAIHVAESKLEEIKRVGLGRGRYCMLSGQRYVDDFVLPNLYFHMTIAYALLRNAGVAIGKDAFMTHLAGDILSDAPTG